MNREIKYRAWSVEQNKMIEARSLHWVGGNLAPDILAPNMKSKGGYDVYASKDVILMQSTGLCDKNGEGIYEGDIVRFNNHICFVKYTIGSFALVVCDADYIERPDEWSALWIDNVVPLCEIMWNCSEFDEWIDEVEVIGNIHENPELLEVKEWK